MTEVDSNLEETTPKIFVTFSFKVWETISSERTNFNVFSIAKSVREPCLHPYVINLIWGDYLLRQWVRGTLTSPGGHIIRINPF